jgi:hypothetical protein
MMAQHLIDLVADDHVKKHEYGCPIPLQEFQDVKDSPSHPSAAAATLEGLDNNAEANFTDEDLATINTIYEPTTGYNDCDINNIETSMDIFGPSTTETLCLDTKHPSLGLVFCSDHAPERPIIKECKSSNPAAHLRNWRSQFQHGTLQAINGKYVDTIADAITKFAQLDDANVKECRITIVHPEISQILTASGIPQLHFDQLHAIAHHLHVLKHGEDYNLWGDTSNWPNLEEETIHQAIVDDQVPEKFTRRQLKTPQ